MDKYILDPCCGAKMFWFDKNHPDVIYGDIRKETIHLPDQTLIIDPDQIMDFKELPFPDKKFKLVVFDPPHLKWPGKNGWMVKKYGKLDKNNWQSEIKQGFSECFRVLDDFGVLIFKWSEHDIKVSEILKCTPYKPLFGHKSGKSMKTHWLCFMKTKQLTALTN